MRTALTLIGAIALSSVVLAQDPTTPDETPEVEETIQVTATRIPEAVLDVPASITVVTGEEIEARGARDLSSALALVAGVTIAPGGDGGPASSVPELMGLREFDAFLLVVDGVPWGGAFNPDLPTLDMTNVDRIEVLRGSAPVFYGATSFVGVIHVIHHTPDDTPTQVEGWVGNFSSGGARGSTAFGGASFRHSLSASLETWGLAVDRAGWSRGHLLWNGVAKVGSGQLKFWLDLTSVRQEPTSPVPRQGSELSPLVPLDSNQNPSDAKIDADRLHLVVGYDIDIGWADWSSKLALSDNRRDSVRGFLMEEFVPVAGRPNAVGYRQDFSGDDYYLDTHLSWDITDELSMVSGLDLLGGKGKAQSENFVYSIALDGSNPPDSNSLPIIEAPEFEDERLFGGLYSQAIWRPTSRWTVDVGLRVNYVDEKQEGEVETSEGEMRVSDEWNDTRLSGGVGASFRLWEQHSDALWLFADYRDAFKPAAVDFGPEAEGAILEPETAQTIEGGFKGVHLGGRVSWQASAFRMDFDNLVIARTVDGLPSLENAGEQRFEGVELEGRWLLLDALSLQGSWAWHSAKFRDYVREFDGVPTQLDGNYLEMSPDRLGALGLTWAPPRGLTGYVVGNYIGERYLNKRNTAKADAYTTLTAGFGYRFGHGEIRVDGTNLTDERPPVSESELGESSYYRLPARTYTGSLIWRF